MLAPYTVYARLSDALFAASSAFDVCFMYVLFRRQCTICIGHMIYHKKSHAVMLIVLKLRTALDLHFADTRTLGFVVSIAHARRVGVGRRSTCQLHEASENNQHHAPVLVSFLRCFSNRLFLKQDQMMLTNPRDAFRGQSSH